MNKRRDTSTAARGALSIWFSRSKTWWASGLTAQVLVAVAAAVTALTGSISEWAALLLGLISVVGALCRWRGDALRQRADTLLRHVELENGFGWNVDAKMLSDNLVKAIPLEASARARGREQ